MEIRKAENILFEKWKEKRNGLITDGVVNPRNYLNNSIKVLYILKEANGGKDYDLRDFLNNGAHWRTWNNIVRWQFGLEKENSINRFNEIDYVNNDTRKEYLSKIAVVNLKKVSGGKNSNLKEIRKYSFEDKEYLKKQINLYKPDVIICCGTGKIIDDYKLIDGLERWELTTNGIWYSKNKSLIVISYFHPQQYRIKKEKLFNDLIFGFDEIRRI